RRHTRLQGDWSSDVCSSDLLRLAASSLRIGFSFFIAGRRDLAKLYIFAQYLDQAETVFSMHRMQSLYGHKPVSAVEAQHAVPLSAQEVCSAVLLVPGRVIQVVGELQIMGVELSPLAAQRRNLR